MLLRLKSDNTVLYIADSIKVINNKYVINNKNVVHDLSIDDAEILSIDPPYGVKARTHTYDGSSWELTSYGLSLQQRQEVIEEAIAQEAANKLNLTTDPLLLQLKQMTLDQVDSHIDNSFSSIANMTDNQIDTAVDGITTIAGVQAALRSLAKDNAETKRILKIVAKAAVYLIKEM